MIAASHKTRSQIGCLVALICFSAFIAFTAYPYGAWRFGAAFGLLALVSIFLRVGWIVPLTITGTYFGIFVLDPVVKSGTIDSQMNETVGNILFGSIVGFAIGAAIDASRPAATTVPWRFSLRALLIAMTFVAVWLGIVMYLARQ